MTWTNWVWYGKWYHEAAACGRFVSHRTRNSCMKSLWSFSLLQPPATLEGASQLLLKLTGGTQILQCHTGF